MKPRKSRISEHSDASADPHSGDKGAARLAYLRRGERAAVVTSVRTPFVKSFGVFENETPLSLSLRVATELVARTGVDPRDIDEVIWGAVIPQTKNPNVARDVVLFSGLPKTTPGFTLNRACASSLQAVISGADAINQGRAKAVIAGGVEVLSDVPITFSDDARKFLTRLSRAKSLTDKLMLFKTIKPKAFLPKPPELQEPFTGLSMGEHGEIMAVKNNISRARQDEYAMMTHHRAAKAVEQGLLADEVIPVWAGKDKSTPIDHDNIIRGDTTLESLAKLRPAFDKRHGTITAGNSSALTDGASAVLLAGETYAREHGLPILGTVVDSMSIAVDPNDQLLIGPAYVIPWLLAKNGLGMEDVGVYELHEAFAAQVLSCLDSMADETFCREKLGLPKAFGRIPFDRLNIDGSSLAYGHPFGATGGRLVGRALRIAQRKGSRYAVVGICAAGAIAQAVLLETTRPDAG